MAISNFRVERALAVQQAYSEIAALLLKLKAAGVETYGASYTDVLADAIVRAAYEAGIERIK